MPPDETYNSEGSAWSYANAIKNFPERDKIKNIGLLYGVGDGGGGPSEGHIEMVRRAGNMKGLPKVRMAKAIDLFDKLKEQEDVMVRHKGELYLEKHQGTYTTQGKNKLNNRKIEFSLHNTEFISIPRHNPRFVDSSRIHGERGKIREDARGIAGDAPRRSGILVGRQEAPYRRQRKFLSLQRIDTV